MYKYEYHCVAIIEASEDLDSAIWVGMIGGGVGGAVVIVIIVVVVVTTRRNKQNDKYDKGIILALAFNIL